jgi:5-formyltetrahydrofolate cyclo-ligase
MKTTLRQQLRQARRNLDPSIRTDYNQTIAKHCIHYINDQQHIAVYLAQDGEVDLTPLIQWLWQQHKTCYLPVLTQTRTLQFAEYQPQSALKANKLGLLEPDSQSITADKLDIIFAPLVGYDLAGHRLGMGGGFYDATLHNLHSRPTFIGCAYNLQQCDSLPQDDWDIVLDGVITERGVSIFKV